MNQRPWCVSFHQLGEIITWPWRSFWCNFPAFCAALGHRRQLIVETTMQLKWLKIFVWSSCPILLVIFLLLLFFSFFLFLPLPLFPFLIELFYLNGASFQPKFQMGVVRGKRVMIPWMVLWKWVYSFLCLQLSGYL